MCGTRLRVDVEFLIGEGIAHTKPRQEYGVDPQRTERNSKCENVGKCECQNVVFKLEA